MNGANFTGTTFKESGQVGFYFARFIGNTDIIFNWAEFLNKGRVNFSKAVFVGGAQLSFSQTKFSGNKPVNFENTYFSLQKGVSFNNAAFHENVSVSFRGTAFDYGTIIDFRDVDVDEAKKISFDEADLSWCNFLGTNIRNIEFKECSFNKNFDEFLLRKHGKGLVKIKRDKVLDEIIQDKDEIDVAASIIADMEKTDYPRRVNQIADYCKVDQDWEYYTFLAILDYETLRKSHQKELKEEP